MFRSAAAPRRPLLRPLAQGRVSATCMIRPVARFSTKPSISYATKIESKSNVLSMTTYRRNTALVRSYASGAAPGTTRRADKEDAFRHKEVEANPALVSTQSSVHSAFEEVGVEEQEKDTDMMAGIRHDVKIIKDTFALDAIPKEALRVGLAGVIPYLVMSTSTVVCAFEMNEAAHSGTGFLMRGETAEALLHLLEPMQVGYGAVILSCLGTIHWGLEWAKYGGVQGYKRYAIGVATPAVAWPTVFMPIEYALITQFLAFNMLYAVDSATTTRGWTPPWYGTYRFLLTFVVGASIVVSLIGRGQIQDQIGLAPTATKRVQALRAIGQHQEADEQQAADDAE